MVKFWSKEWAFEKNYFAQKMKNDIINQSNNAPNEEIQFLKYIRVEQMPFYQVENIKRGNRYV